MGFRSRIFGWLLLAAGLLISASPIFPQADVSADAVIQESARFARIYGAVEQNYAEALDPERAIWDGGIRRMLSLLDPFSAFFDRQQFELLQQQARGEALGFGSVLYVQPGKVVILQTSEGSPSWRAGLGPGDEIVEVNATRIDRLDLQALIELLERSRSHPVRLGVVRAGTVVARDFELKPAEVPMPTVDRIFALAPRTGYIHLSGFELKTTQEIADAVKRLAGPEGKNLDGLLLDLRDNHGGMIDAALGVASLFLKPDLTVLTVRGRTAPEKTYRTTSSSSTYDGPLIVLVNGNTASAAEVVTAALEEHDRAVIVGNPTFGKGVVETVMGLGEKTGLALTTAQYFTPSGRSIQRPLPETALAISEVRFDPAAERSPGFHTDNGRPISGGGGVTPDVAIPPREIDPWAGFLNQRSLISTFAAEYISRHGKVQESFDPDEKVLDQFKDFLARSGVRSPEEYWNKDQDYLKLRIKTEIFNFAFGLARGNEVEVRGDPEVQRAVKLFPKVEELLKPPGPKPAKVRVRRVARR